LNTGASKYRLVVINDSGSGTQAIPCTGTSYNFTPSVAGSWRWQVQSYLSSGQPGDAPTARGITVNAATVKVSEPGIPSLNSPQDGYSMRVGQTVNLQWSNTGASSYRLVVINDTGTGTQAINCTGTSYNFTPSVAGSWRWQVQSYLSSGQPGDAPRAWGITVNKIEAEYNPPSQPNPSSPNNGASFRSAAPTLSWSGVSSPSGGRVEYQVEIFDSPVGITSPWMTETSWRPSEADAHLGSYNWHVKAIDRTTGKESGWGNVSQFIIERNPDSTDLRLDIRRALYGANDRFDDITSKVRPFIVNDERIDINVNNDLCGYDPVPNVKKKLIVTYRNRWNEERRITINEGDKLILSRDSTSGEFLLDGDNQ